MKEKEGSIEIDLKRLLLVLLRRAWLLLLVGILCAATAFVYAKFFVTPMYSASTKLYVNNTYGQDTEGFSSSQIMAAQELANSYIVILKSYPVTEQILEKTGLDYTHGQLMSMISAMAIDETEIFRVTVTCANYKHAAQIANAIADILPGRVADIVSGSSLRVVEYARESTTPVSPNVAKYTVLAFIVGFALVALVLVVVELLDESINSEEYLTRVYPDIPLLAVIPDAEVSSSYGRYYKGYYESERAKSPVPPTATGGDAK